MKRPGIVQRTCAILADLMRGDVHDRHSLAQAHGVTLAAADRYIRELLKVPGVNAHRAGRKLRINWADATAGLRVLPSAQASDLLYQLAGFGIYGTTSAEVAERLIDQGLERFVPIPVLAPRQRGTD